MHFEPLFSSDEGYNGSSSHCNREQHQPQPARVSQPGLWNRQEAAQRKGSVDAVVLEPLRAEFGDQALTSVKRREINEIRDHFQASGRRYLSPVDQAGVKAMLGEGWNYQRNHSSEGVHTFILTNDYEGNQQRLTFDGIHGSVVLTSRSAAGGGAFTTERIKLYPNGDVIRENDDRPGSRYERRSRFPR